MNFEVPVIDRFQLLSSCESNLNEIPACFFLETSDGIWTSRLLNPFNEIQNHLPKLQIRRLPEQLHQHLLGKQLLPWPLQWQQRWRQGQLGSAGSVGRVGRAECSKMPRMITLWSGWLVCLVWFPLFWLGFAVGLGFVCFCLFVWLVGWLVIVAILYLIALIGWVHKGIFELDKVPGRLGSAGSPMKLIDPSILSELAIDVERDLNRNGK